MLRRSILPLFITSALIARVPMARAPKAPAPTARAPSAPAQERPVKSLYPAREPARKGVEDEQTDVDHHEDARVDVEAFDGLHASPGHFVTLFTGPP